MAMTLSSGTLTEDFNYGNPYTDLRMRLASPYFTYSTHVKTSAGYVTSVGYRRKDYQIHHLTPADEPLNLDTSPHGGAHLTAPYYMTFPTLGWNDCQVISLAVRINSGGGVLSFDRAFTGSTEDFFHLIIDSREVHFNTHTAAHHWMTTTYPIHQGNHKIYWVYRTPAWHPPSTTVRGGATRAVATNKKPPAVRRVFRICNISITNVASMPAVATNIGNLGGAGTPTFAGRRGRTVGSKRRFLVQSMFQKGVKYAGSQFFLGTATATFTSHPKVQMTNQVPLAPVATFTGQGHNFPVSQTVDAEILVNASAGGHIVVPVATPQALQKTLMTASLTMTAPVIINGQPIFTTYPGTITATTTSAGGYSYTDRADPHSIAHVLPVTMSWRWLSTDVSGADGASVSTWPEHSGSGPAWNAPIAIYQPTVQSHESYSGVHNKLVRYDRVVHFDPRFVQHFQLTMDVGHQMSGAQACTWQIVGIMGLPARGIMHWVLDAGNATPDYTDEIADYNDINLVQQGQNESISNNRNVFAFHYRSIQMQGANTVNPVYRQVPSLHTIPVVYTIWMNNGSQSGFWIRSNPFRTNLKYHFNAGSSQVNSWLLGRRQNWVSHKYAGSMSVMEVAFINRALTDAEAKKNADWLASVWQFQDYVDK